MKNDINWYLNRAKKEQSITSDRKLAIALSIATISDFRNPYRHSVPSQTLMTKIAELASIPVEIALIDRDIWEANYKAPETVAIYQKIKDALKSLPQYAATLIITFILSVSAVDIEGGNSACAGERGGTQVPSQYILWNIL